MKEIVPIENYKLNIRHDGSLPVATGKSRMEKVWKNKTMTWSALLKRLQEPTRTQETHKEYISMTKTDQDRIKDVGGFVGGYLKNGQRKTENVENRQLVTLDADFAPCGLLEDLEMFTDYAYAVYSTHKHTPEKPRLRILIPLDRPVTPDEYEAISRKIAEEIGMDYFDDTTFQPSRLMYWGSVSLDGEYIFTYEDLPWLCADDVLARYPDWTDTSYWPESSRVKEQRKKTAKKQGDPTEKSGPIGDFCRTYSIEEAIEKFIPDTYIKCDMPGRYTYAEGSTAAGLVIYEDGKFAYSNHATDPASGKLCNAFDLVRIHKFGIQDEDAPPETATKKLPSYKAMMELVLHDEETGVHIARSKVLAAKEEFTDSGNEVTDDHWIGRLKRNKNGYEPSLENLLLIMRCDENLSSIAFNQMNNSIEVNGKLPWGHPGKLWRDADDAQLEAYLCKHYAEFPKSKVFSAVAKVADDRKFHPVRDYLDSLPEWDGVPRVNTLLVDYLGAEDTEYVRAVTRKTLCAAVHRVRQPGCKFDTVLILCGPQGIGKSTLIHKLGGEWFSDSLNLADTRDKTAAEKLQGYWIIEIGEMAGLGSAGTKTLRSFITSQDDKYRASYGRHVSSHPRQCVLIGTTNAQEGYLNDAEGNRRFWPVNTPRAGKKKVWDMTDEEVGQIWAEVLCIVESGESLILTGETLEEAKKQQKGAMASDPREAMVREYLDRMLPGDWYSRTSEKREDFLHDCEIPVPETPLRRDFICCQEIWCECFGYPLNKMEPKDTYTIRKILEKIEGWENRGERKRVGADYGQQRGYSRIDARKACDNRQ